MAIIQTVNQYQIIDIVNKHDRLDNFGYQGWLKLFDHIEQESEDTGQNIEVDIVAWCCEYNMHESPQEVFDNHSTGIDYVDWLGMDDEEKLEAICEFLADNTTLVCCEDDCIIFACF